MKKTFYFSIENHKNIIEFYDSVTSELNYTFHNEDILFGPLSKINFFVGANNSGKSRFMRGLLKIDPNYLKYFPENYNEKLFNIIQQIEAKKAFSLRGGTIDINRRDSFQGFSDDDIIDLYENFLLFTKKGKKQENSQYNNDYFTPRLNYNITHFYHLFDHPAYSERNNFLCDFFEIIKNTIENTVEWNNQKHYIPILRSSYNINENKTEDKFSNKIAEMYDLKIDEKSDIFIHTGQSLYKEVLEARNTDHHTLDKITKFEEFLSETFFNGVRISIIAKFELNGNSKDENLLIKFADSTKTRAIHDLGDGIQAIIMLLFPVFNSNDGDWIFFEEPETHLHPAYQRIFIETLKKFDRRYFITTHSNHLLDTTIEYDNDEVSILSFSRTDNEKHLIKSVFSGDKNILDELGVNSSSVFLSNSSIWVEGITDRLYIKRFLHNYYNSEEFKKTNKSLPKEDIDYSFFEYAGSNVEHYFWDKEDNVGVDEGIDLSSLSNKVLMIADRDGNTKTKRDSRLEKFSKENNNFTYKLISEDYREIENLISLDELKTIYKEVFPNIKATDLPQSFELTNNQYLGTQLSKTFKDDWLYSYGKKTIKGKYKTDLAKKYFEKCHNWDLMSDEAKSLTKYIYNFISS